MDLIITKEKPKFNLFAQKLREEGVSEEEINKRLEDMVFVQFPNCISIKTGKPFKWMPTYKQLLEIKKELDEIEERSWKKYGCHQK